MPENLIDELVKNFRDLHQSQLKSCGLPEQYWDYLFFKIKDEVKKKKKFHLLIFCLNRFLMPVIIFKFV